MKIRIPYHTGAIEAECPENNLCAVLQPQPVAPVPSETLVVQEALAHPIGSSRLSALAAGKRRITVLTSDHTRAMPSRLTLPLLLREIRAGNPSAEITVLIGTGLHRAPTREEQRHMFGDEILAAERIAVHDANAEQNFRSLGTLPSGAPCEVNRLAADCDLLVSEGFIEPHFFAGYSGGRKSVLPAVCSARTIRCNHAYPMVAHARSTAGALSGNPIHADMEAAARMAGLAFILNVTLDQQKRITGAYAGDPFQAYAAGVAAAHAYARCPLVRGDIIITGNGGYPLDQNLYQVSKAAFTAALCANAGGVIILCSACVDGVGGAHFEALMRMESPQAILAHLAAIPSSESVPEQWNVQTLAEVLTRHRVILVSDGIPKKQAARMHLLSAASLGEALDMALDMRGPAAKIVVIPDGVAVLPEADAEPAAER